MDFSKKSAKNHPYELRITIQLLFLVSIIAAQENREELIL